MKLKYKAAAFIVLATAYASALADPATLLASAIASITTAQVVMTGVSLLAPAVVPASVTRRKAPKP